MSITRGSERNSRRYRRTARASGASGVPRLISSSPCLRASAFTSTPRTRLHPSRSSVERVGEGERELRDPRLEARPVRTHHEVRPAHRAERRAEHRPAGVLEALSRLELRLLPHHPFTPNLLHPAIGIGDDPVTAPQLRRTFTDVRDLHR